MAGLDDELISMAEPRTEIVTPWKADSPASGPDLQHCRSLVFHPQDAEEVTQEVLIKAITRLSTFQGKSKFRTWLYRNTANHVLNMQRCGGQTQPQSFSRYAAAINDVPDLDWPDAKSMPADLPVRVGRGQRCLHDWNAALS